jgi:hypothetical protein
MRSSGCIPGTKAKMRGSAAQDNNSARIYIRGGAMKIDIYCPVCAAAGINHGKGRLLMQVDSNATGTVYPYCKSCKKNIKIDLKGDKSA